jgi:tetratricopeptide (TPR) repeat protein
MSHEQEWKNEPANPDELLAFYKILRQDPQRYLRIVNEWIVRNPDNPHAYFSRYQGWMKIGEPRRALEDLNKVVELEGGLDPMCLMSRGLVYRHLGEYENALQDFDHAQDIDPKQWENDIVFGLLYQADVHARLGNEAAALSYCARLPDDFWTPGVYGTPRGGKAEIADELRRKAAKARKNP